MATPALLLPLWLCRLQVLPAGLCSLVPARRHLCHSASACLSFPRPLASASASQASRGRHGSSQACPGTPNFLSGRMPTAAPPRLCPPLGSSGHKISSPGFLTELRGVAPGTGRGWHAYFPFELIKNRFSPRLRPTRSASLEPSTAPTPDTTQ